MIDFESAPESGAGAARRFAGASSFGASGAPAGQAPLTMQTPESELPPYLRSLNPRQREAALAVEGPLLVLAGAGSGKTQMLISRIAYLVGHLGVQPWQILAVTFTNKAAREMNERVTKVLGGGAGSSLGHFGAIHHQPEIGTFHSVCVRLLRREREFTPFTKPFVIYDDSDQLSLIKSVMKGLNIDDKMVNPKGVQAFINRAKCDAHEPEDIKPGEFSLFEKQAKKIYEAYQRALFGNNALDFGEIITMTYRILRDNPELRARYQARFRYLHVDEYQDTNRAQYLLLMQLASGNMCVVGDEDQSIYKWRGADIRNILDFEKDFPGARIVKLEQNYRSTQIIISAASKVIGNNSQRKEKTLWTANPQGEPIRVIRFVDERAEADHVGATISQLVREGGMSLSDFALFYRTHAQSRQFEDVFRRENMPYQVVGGVRFYDRKEIKDVLSYFRVILNPSDSVSLMRIINVPGRGIGKTTLERLDDLLAVSRASVGDSGEGGASDLWSLLGEVTSGQHEVGRGAVPKLQAFVKIVRRLMEEQPKLLLSELYHLLLDETGYVRSLKEENTVESLARVENLEELDTLLQEFEEDQLRNVGEVGSEPYLAAKSALLERFIETSTLASEADKEFQPASIKLMTLHSSKGLEFPVVFMVGMEEGLFPSTRPWEDTPPEEIEEERRLCYVGMTRARKRLFMSHCVARRLWGQFLYQEPARFLDEIPSEFIEAVDLSYGGRPKPTWSGSGYSPDEGASRSSASPARAKSLAGPAGTTRVVRDEYSQDAPSDVSFSGTDLLGRKLKHPTYGSGTIVEASGSGEQAKVTVEFAYRVRRKFLFRFVAEFLG
ncbi:MAG: UvrD-helicase domain-containing protein [Bdellovibrionales bacterium]|nr:UvrD-helicase domain-containing protein [Bdellovibrionales bacterium]